MGLQQEVIRIIRRHTENNILKQNPIFRDVCLGVGGGPSVWGCCQKEKSLIVTFSFFFCWFGFFQSKVVLKSGVEKLTRSSLKGVLNRALFAYKNGRFWKQFSPLRYRMFRSFEKGKFVFQKSLSETPFKPDRVSFCTPNKRFSRPSLHGAKSFNGFFFFGLGLAPPSRDCEALLERMNGSNIVPLKEFRSTSCLTATRT